MINDLIEYFRDKKIIILGFGREGVSTYRLIRKYLPTQTLYIGDKSEEVQNNEELQNDNNLIFKCGEEYLENLKDYDIIMKSPGISFVNLDTSEFFEKIKSQLELLLEYCNNTTIGITGTKGKSTTSSLIYKILEEQGVKSILLGNIGVPVFDYIDQIDEDEIIVLEMSSHQLEYMKKSPNIAILLNIFQEHLDHYKSFGYYAKAKCNINRYQTEKDAFLYNGDNETIRRFMYFPRGRTYNVSYKGAPHADIYLDGDMVYFKGEPIYNKNQPRNLQGDYNLNNIMFVLGVSKILGLDLNKTIKSISDFKPLRHRLENIGTYNDVTYYDNSIGTIPEATIEAVKALESVDTLIIGGTDRGLDYTEFTQYLNDSGIGHIICLPETGHIIAQGLRPEICHIVNNLEEAVSIAKKVTKKGSICLLSPAAASYGFFKNFEERGDAFKKLVQNGEQVDSGEQPSIREEFR